MDPGKPEKEVLPVEFTMSKEVTPAVATLSRLEVPKVELQISVFDALGCDPPGEFEPLLNLVNSLVGLITVGSLGVGVLMLTYAGLVYMFGSRDQIERGKRRIRAVVTGLLIVMSANMVVVWLASRLEVC